MPTEFTSLDDLSIGLNELSESGEKDLFYSPVSDGTTIIAVQYDQGVILGADSQTSRGRQLVSTKTRFKLARLHERIFCGTSGRCADSKAVLEVIKNRLHLKGIIEDSAPRVRVAAHIASKLCYEHRNNLETSLIIGGWDPVEGPQVYAIPIGGMMTQLPVAAGGSGSTYIYGYIDSMYKPGMSREECIRFVSNCVSLAMSRDSGSGGVIRLVAIDKDEANRMVLAGDEIPKFYQG